MDDGSPTLEQPVGPMSEHPSAALAHPQMPTERRRARFLGPCLILGLALLAYVPTLGGGFPFDDERFIVQNKLITSLRHLPILLASPYWAIDPGSVKRGSMLYRPLLTVSFAFNYALGGLQPFGYHVVNLALHAAVSLAVYGVGRLLFLSPPGAIVAGALFAVHPLHTEAVAGIVGRAELLMALGVLLTLAGYRRDQKLARFGSLAAFALGLLAKEQAMALPALLLLHELTTRIRSPEPGPWRALIRPAVARLVPYCGILGAYLLLRIWVLGGFAGTSEVRHIAFLDNPLAHVPLVARLLTALVVAGRYLRLCLLPISLSPDYSYNQIPLATSPLDGRVLAAVVLWVILVGVAIQSYRRGGGAAATAVGFTALTFLPASNLLMPIGTIMGDRLFYLPSVGLCWLAGLGWEIAQKWTDRLRLRSAAWGVIGVILLVFATQTIRYGRVWRDDFTLFSYAVTAAPDSAKMRFNLGSALLFTDRKEEAIAHLRRAVEIYPAYTQAWDALGRASLDTKQWEKAIEAFAKALSLAPDYPYSHNNLGLAFVGLGRWDEAMSAFRRAVALKPDMAQAHRNLADVYDRRGWSEAALAERALELNPTDPLAWLQAGTTYLRLGWPDEALLAFQQAVRLGPEMPEARLALAQAYDGLNRPAEAADAYEALLRLRPHLPAIHRRLVELYTTRLHDPAKGQAHLRQAEGSGRPGRESSGGAGNSEQ